MVQFNSRNCIFHIDTIVPLLDGSKRRIVFLDNAGIPNVIGVIAPEKAVTKLSEAGLSQICQKPLNRSGSITGI